MVLIWKYSIYNCLCATALLITSFIFLYATFNPPPARKDAEIQGIGGSGAATDVRSLSSSQIVHTIISYDTNIYKYVAPRIKLLPAEPKLSLFVMSDDNQEHRLHLVQKLGCSLSRDFAHGLARCDCLWGHQRVTIILTPNCHADLVYRNGQTVTCKMETMFHLFHANPYRDPRLADARWLSILDDDAVVAFHVLHKWFDRPKMHRLSSQSVLVSNNCRWPAYFRVCAKDFYTAPCAAVVGIVSRGFLQRIEPLIARNWLQWQSCSLSKKHDVVLGHAAWMTNSTVITLNLRSNVDPKPRADATMQGILDCGWPRPGFGLHPVAHLKSYKYWFTKGGGINVSKDAQASFFQEIYTFFDELELGAPPIVTCKPSEYFRTKHSKKTPSQSLETILPWTVDDSMGECDVRWEVAKTYLVGKCNAIDMLDNVSYDPSLTSSRW